MESKTKTIFERIIAGELPADKVYESDRILVIKDIAPKAPIHLLIIPKKAIPSLQAVQAEDLPLVTEIIQVAQAMAKRFDLDKGGYRLLVNHGSHAGQTIDHLHFHLLGGAFLGELA